MLSPLNPWHERDWRSGVFRFRAAHTFGYGAAAGLCRKRLGTLDSLGVQGTSAAALGGVGRAPRQHTGHDLTLSCAAASAA